MDVDVDRQDTQLSSTEVNWNYEPKTGPNPKFPNAPPPLSSIYLYKALAITMTMLTEQSPLYSLYFLPPSITGHCGHTSPCDQLCYEIHDGMYECDCIEGYELNKNGYSCQGAFRMVIYPMWGWVFRLGMDVGMHRCRS